MASYDSYSLLIAQYDLPGHACRSEHWKLVALTDPNNGWEFELAGNWNNFHYVARQTTRFGRTQSLRGGCQVGTVPASKIESIKTRLKEVEIIYNDRNFDCQNWTTGALRMLQADGLEITMTSEVNIRKELAVERERWDAGEDTIEDRLFARM